MVFSQLTKFLNKTNGQTRCLEVKNVTYFGTEGVETWLNSYFAQDTYN